MTATDDFFAELERRGHEPMLRRVSPGGGLGRMTDGDPDAGRVGQ
jgi:hypothetical protein